MSILANLLCSTLERIERRSQELLAKGTAARFVDKSADSGEVARLVDELREAITHYQVSKTVLMCRVRLTTQDRFRNNKRSTNESPTSVSVFLVCVPPSL